MNHDELLAQLLQEVLQMRSELQTVIEQQTPTSPWIPPREFAALLNVSVRSIAAWRHKGRFRPESIRAIQCGDNIHWEYHRINAFKDIKH